MSRGFDGPEIDDFHGPARGVNRSPESNRRAGWDAVRRLERIRGEEERADQRDQEGRGPVRPDQATYHGLKKPKEAFHDAELYRLYHKVSNEIEGRGGKVVRVKLDYEIKRDLYADLSRTWKDKSKCPETVKEAVARRHGLKVVNKEIQIPDMRLEYANDPDMEIHTRDVELATEHYRPRGLAAKARAGFQIYARRGEADRLRRIRDQLELSAVIFSL
jgi:hypothetical protein